MQVGAGVALEGGAGAVLADALGADVVGAQQPGQVAGGQRVAIPVGPGGVLELVQGLQDAGGVERLGGAEDLTQLGQKPDAGRGVLFLLSLGSGHGGGGAGPGRPVTAGEVGDGDQRFPGVGGPVLEGHGRGGVLELAELLAGPAVEVVAELVEGWGVTAGAGGAVVVGGGGGGAPPRHAPPPTGG